MTARAKNDVENRNEYLGMLLKSPRCEAAPVRFFASKLFAALGGEFVELGLTAVSPYRETPIAPLARGHYPAGSKRLSSSVAFGTDGKAPVALCLCDFSPGEASALDWAAREGAVHAPAKKDKLQVAAQLIDDESVERHALLRHFLNLCVANSLLSDAELDLLIQIKLDGNSGEEIAELNSITCNAVRQRMKRLLAKPRRIAGND